MVSTSSEGTDMNHDSKTPARPSAASGRVVKKPPDGLPLTKEQRSRRLLNPAHQRMATCAEVEEHYGDDKPQVGAVIDFDGAA